MQLCDNTHGIIYIYVWCAEDGTHPTTSVPGNNLVYFFFLFFLPLHLYNCAIGRVHGKPVPQFIRFFFFFFTCMYGFCVGIISWLFTSLPRCVKPTNDFYFPFLCVCVFVIFFFPLFFMIGLKGHRTRPPFSFFFCPPIIRKATAAGGRCA